MRWIFWTVAAFAVLGTVVVVVLTSRTVRGYRQLRVRTDEIIAQMDATMPAARPEPPMRTAAHTQVTSMPPTLTVPLHSYQLTGADRAWIEKRLGREFKPHDVVVLPSGLATTGAEMCRWVATVPVREQRP